MAKTLLVQEVLPFNPLPWLPLLTLMFLSFISLFLFMKMKAPAKTNLPPSPPRLPIIGNLHQLGKIPHFSLWKLSRKYGPVMYLQLGQIPTVVVSSPESAREVLKTNDLECCSRPYSHGTKRLTYDLLDVAFGPYSDYWREMRKLCVIELFTAKRVKSFWRVRDEELSRLINSISQVSPKDPVKLTEKIFSFTNSIICKIAFGTRCDGNQFGGRKLDEVMDEVMNMLSSFWAADFFPFFGEAVDFVMGRHGRLEKCFHEFDRFFERLIEDHLNPARPEPDHEDIIDILLHLSKDETASVPLSRDHIKSVLMDIFLGAIDTSSLTMVWAMSELARNPRVMRKVQAEIRSCIGKKPKVEESKVEKLKYLKMVVKETFRLHPPATLLLPRESMQHCKIGGYDVYPKTRILVNAWAIGRDPETWKNPYDFYPERFEGSEVDFRGQHFELVPFGAGRRICPGLTMGTTAVEFTLANLLYSFNWELPSGMTPDDINMEEAAGLTVHKKTPLYLVPVKYNWQE